MRVLRSWLEEYGEIKLNDSELTLKLSGTGTDVEAVTNLIDDKMVAAETLFDLDITPNRGDCLSHLGVAREIAAIQDTNIRREPIKLLMDSKQASSEIAVKIEAKKECSQYLARVIKGVKIEPSPQWLSAKLEKIGVKPINNVVDITNLIMYDLGQPLHAFDLSKIAGNKIIIRLAKSTEKIITLEGKERNLEIDDLVIADAETAIAIAGVMGGANAEISQETRDVVLEAAVFDQRAIRKTAKKLSLVTDASFRFERGIDAMGVEYAINKAAFLIKKIAGGAILSGIVRQGESPKLDAVEIKPLKINALLGLNLLDEEINVLLRRLGFEIDGEVVKVPSWRHDIYSWQDLAEEVGRLYGYDKVPLERLPVRAAKAQGNFYLKESLKDQLVGLGFVESINYPFLSEAETRLVNENVEELLEIANPVQPENKYLRPSLVNGLFKTVSKNSAFNSITIFEVGQVFSKSTERTHLAVVVATKDQESALTLITQVREKLSGFLNTDLLVNVQEIDQETLKKLKIRKPSVVYFEIDLSKLMQNIKANKILDLKVSDKTVIYRPVSRYPSVTRDLAFIVDRKIKPDDIIKSIYEIAGSVNRVEVFDEFISDKFGKNKKNLAFHLFLQDMNKTLSDSAADKIISVIIDNIKKNFSAELRS